ncbi:MAG: hypothetical protein KJ600_05505 [Nanoarchaeota archaeon]|nr:hypothetical protein [Nanoarchaeota archaeon]MBU1103984.1 hypothetical protein [Nanoarchaeota archaeon]
MKKITVVVLTAKEVKIELLDKNKLKYFTGLSRGEGRIPRKIEIGMLKS